MSSAIRRVAALLSLAAVNLAALAPARGAEKSPALFNGKDLADWRRPAGAWQTAKSVSPDPADDKKFYIEAGPFLVQIVPLPFA